MSKGGMTKKETTQANALLKLLLSKEESEAFRMPVDYYAMDLPDYPSIIRKPMDLSTVQRRVGKYKTFKDFLAEVKLIWDNCRTYNKAKSPIYQSANVMEAYVADFLEHYVDNTEEPPPPPLVEPLRISFDDKIGFLTTFRELPRPQMVQLAKLIEAESPESVEQFDSDHVRIRLECIPKGVFPKLQQFLRENVVGEPEPVKKTKKSE